MKLREALAPSPPAAGTMSRLTELVFAIEAADNQAERDRHLAAFNEIAPSRRDLSEVLNHWRSEDTASFVRRAATPTPRWVEDATYDEIAEVVRCICAPRSGAAGEQELWLEVLEAQFPAIPVSDLIFWPNVFFGDERLLHVSLTAEECVDVLMSRAGRQLRGVPEGRVAPTVEELLTRASAE